MCCPAGEIGYDVGEYYDLVCPIKADLSLCFIEQLAHSPMIVEPADDDCCLF